MVQSHKCGQASCAALSCECGSSIDECVCPDSADDIWLVLFVLHAFSFALHIKSWPFRHPQENILKATTEAHVFVVLLFVLTMKTDLHGEVLVPGDYGECACVHGLCYIAA